jgi:ABC-type uncharacterized transport system involved in gliding motility auxiliary subunit
MKKLRRFAPLGLYLSGLAVLASIVLYAIYRQFNLPLQISLAVIVVGLAIYVLLDPQRTREALTGRQARYGSNMVLMAIAFTGILVVINYLTNQYGPSWDLTEDKTNTLAPETIDTLNSLKSPVKAEAYFSSRMNPASTRDLLDVYKQQSKGKFDYEFIDPEANPIRAEQAKVKLDGTVVLKMEDRQELVTYPTQNELTAGIVRLANPGERVLYFTTGHGEHVLDTSGDNNYSTLVTALKDKNYTVKQLNLQTEPGVPADAKAVIVAGPTNPLTSAEVDKIKAYMDKGGSLVYLAEPTVVTQIGDQVDLLDRYTLESWGIYLGKDLILDQTSQQLVVAISDPTSYANHAIMQKIANLNLVMPSARSVNIESGVPQEIQLTELAKTSTRAWGETDLKALATGKAEYNAGADHQGPITLAVAGINSTTKGRVIVVGDSDFANSNAFNQYGNGDFIVNSIDWVTEQENLINLTVKQETQRMILPATTATIGLVFLGSVILLPGLTALAGILVWLQRRRRG